MSEQQVEESPVESTTTTPIAEETQIESAPIIETETPEETPEITQDSEPEKLDVTERVQARFDKFTQEKYELKNQLEAANAKLNEKEQVKTEPLVDPGTMPKLSDEDIGYDEEKHTVAVKVWAEKVADFKAEKKLSAREQAANMANEQTAFNKKKSAYDARVQTFMKEEPEWQESVSKMPLMNKGAANALIAAGPEATFHLSKNSELLHRINKMSNEEGSFEIGKLSVQLSTTNKKLISGAPEPIVPLKGGGTMNTSLPWDKLIGKAKFS